MNALWTDCAQDTLPAETNGATKHPAERQATAIRSLDEWELALASGGEGGWEWP